MACKFKIGDRVRFIDPGYGDQSWFNQIGTVSRVDARSYLDSEVGEPQYMMYVHLDNGEKASSFHMRWELALPKVKSKFSQFMRKLDKMSEAHMTDRRS